MDRSLERVASSGREGVSRLFSHHPEIIVLILFQSQVRFTRNPKKWAIKSKFNVSSAAQQNLIT